MITKKEFEQIKIIEVLDHYDSPLVFTFINSNNDFYLAYYCDTEIDLVTKNWLYLLTNQFSVDELKSDKISIRNFIQRSKLIVQARTIRNTVDQVVAVSFDSLPEGYVPEDEVFLESDNKDIVVKLNKKNISPSNVKGEIVALVVSRVSEGLRAIMKDVKSHFENDYKDLVADPGLALTAIKAGSVELVFKPLEHSPLFNKSLELLNKVVVDDASFISSELATSIKRHVINMAPTNRRGFNFDSLSFYYPAVGQKITSFELTNELRKELKSSLPKEPNSEIVVILVGTIKEYDKRDSSFMLCDIEANQFGISFNVRCSLMTVNYQEDQVEEIALELFTADKKAKVIGKFNSKETKVFVQSVSEF